MKKINNIPSPTWNWLHMNEASIENISGTASDVVGRTTKGFEYEKRADFAVSNIKTGMGEEVSNAVAEAGSVLSFSVGENIETETLRLDIEYEKSSIDGIEFRLGKNAHAVVVMKFSGLSEGEEATVQTRYSLAEGATLALVQINQVSKDARFLNDIGGVVADDAEFKLYQLILGGKQNYYGTFSALEGKRAAFTSDMAYSLLGDDLLDINTVADHTGKKTTCDINVSGVLRDTSKKIFRGTIDFHRGCAGATGNEMENVLLMDDNVRNQTIPVILCDEEDVEGNHGASIGNIDEELMFYMKSRGIDERSIYETMAKAFVDKVVAKIPDEETRKCYMYD